MRIRRKYPSGTLPGRLPCPTICAPCQADSAKRFLFALRKNFAGVFPARAASAPVAWNYDGRSLRMSAGTSPGLVRDLPGTSLISSRSGLNPSGNRMRSFFQCFIGTPPVPPVPAPKVRPQHRILAGTPAHPLCRYIIYI